MEKQDFEATLEPLLAEPRTGKTVAYIHVPFCETHCLYCGFYNKAYREDESRIYADALIQELRLWRGRPGQDAGPVHAVYMGGGTPTALQADDLRRILKEVRAVLAARQRLRDHGGRASVEFRPGQDGSVLRGRGKPFFTRGAEL